MRTIKTISEEELEERFKWASHNNKRLQLWGNGFCFQCGHAENLIQGTTGKGIRRIVWICEDCVDKNDMEVLK